MERNDLEWIALVLQELAANTRYVYLPQPTDTPGITGAIRITAATGEIAILRQNGSDDLWEWQPQGMHPLS